MKRILGIDLAWGERRPDGVCALEVSEHQARVRSLTLTRGDDELLDWIGQHQGPASSLLAVDAPLVCPNISGSRPVDRLTHVHFGRYYAGCHPTNQTLCPRPSRLAKLLVEQGYNLGWSLEQPKVLAEVYPHPAMIRLFNLQKSIPYKRGQVAQRRGAFRDLQAHLQTALPKYFPGLQLDSEFRTRLQTGWTKNIEDQTDAFFCALIGYWHWLHRGTKTQVLGDLLTGFLLIPQP